MTTKLKRKTVDPKEIDFKQKYNKLMNLLVQAMNEVFDDAQDAARAVYSSRELLIHPIQLYHGLRPWPTGFVFHAGCFDLFARILRNVCRSITGRRYPSSPVGNGVPKGDPFDTVRDSAQPNCPRLMRLIFAPA